jgi:Fe-S-cluster containining protein
MSDRPRPATPRGNDAELSWLCRACGLCCDGSLFGRVDLETREIEQARRRRLRVVRDGKSFEQPCSAFAGARPPSDRCGCTIYEDRPLSCRRFVCRLHEKHRCEGGSIDEPLSVVRRARLLLASLGTPSDTAQVRAELTRILEESFARA